MTTKPRQFNTGYYYHVYNRGTEKRTIFPDHQDYQRFLETAIYYLNDQRLPYSNFLTLAPETRQEYLKNNPRNAGNLRVKVSAYCLMPNHFHFLLKPSRSDGITRFISDLSNSYTRYFNLKCERSGVLFQGTFKAKEVTSEPSFLQLSRYIHLNPALSSKVEKSKRPEDYPYSSYRAWLKLREPSLEHGEELENWLALSGGSGSYRKFVEAKMNQNPALGIESITIDS